MFSGMVRTNFLLIIFAAILFTLSHPNIIFSSGLPFLAWVMYIPALIVIKNASLRSCIFYGGLYGCLSFTLFTYWINAYHPLAGLTVSLLYLVYFSILFPLLKTAILLFKRNGYLIQWLLWVSFEYLRTKGFLGFGYGITAYTQWRTVPLLQISNIFGVWGISALIIFPSMFLSAFLSGNPGKTQFSKLPAALWAFALIAALVYGFSQKNDFSTEPNVKISLIQNNLDPWKDQISDYKNNLDILKRLSSEALNESEEKPDLVVWPETAFVPMIYWHIHYRTSEEYYTQVKELLDYFSRYDIPFLIGNDDGRRETDENGTQQRVDYNAALLFKGNEIVDYYRKMHLVPFAESFPYKKQLPFVYKLLLKTKPRFWKQGDRATVFNIDVKNGLDGLKFSVPICFEDTFSDIPRQFVNAGAELFVNISNDSWSHSLASQMQHLSMAVFRSVETRRATVRSTVSGQTCAINPDGNIIAMLEPFTEGQLTVSVPIMKTETFYTKHGDFFPVICTLLSFALLLIACILHIIN
jgi:apolipoprotein N-acyltransferase